MYNAITHDDHIWIMAGGVGWAIRRVVRENHRPIILMLWRGYAPDIEYFALDVTDIDWDVYCDKALDMLVKHWEL